ncbi:hypothetical protein TKK_0003109 [Trichogramma kaykai]
MQNCINQNNINPIPNRNQSLNVCWTRRLINDLTLWIERKFGAINYYVTQFLTGYGYFRQHFFNKKKVLKPNCMYCGHERDDAEHTFFHCVKWTPRRQELQSVYGVLTPDNIIGVMLRDKETWTTFVVFIETVLKRKKADRCLRDK